MQSVASESADFFDREVRITKKVHETVTKSVSANVPDTDRTLVQLYLWEAIRKQAESHIKDIKTSLVAEFSLDDYKEGFKGPIAAGEYAVLSLQVRPGGANLDRTALANRLRREGYNDKETANIIEECLKPRASSKILTVSPKV